MVGHVHASAVVRVLVLVLVLVVSSGKTHEIAGNSGTTTRTCLLIGKVSLVNKARFISINSN